MWRNIKWIGTFLRVRGRQSKQLLLRRCRLHSVAYRKGAVDYAHMFPKSLLQGTRDVYFIFRNIVIVSRGRRSPLFTHVRLILLTYLLSFRLNSAFRNSYIFRPRDLFKSVYVLRREYKWNYWWLLYRAVLPPMMWYFRRVGAVFDQLWLTAVANRVRLPRTVG